LCTASDGDVLCTASDEDVLCTASDGDVLCTASDGDVLCTAWGGNVSQMPYVCNGSNGHNIIGLTSEVVGKYYSYINQKEIYLVRKKVQTLL